MDLHLLNSLLATAEQPRRVLHVCDDIACRCNGAIELCAALEAATGAAVTQVIEGDPAALDPSRPIWLRSPCLGMCDHAPAALLSEAGEHPFDGLLGDLTVADAESILDPSTTALGDSRSWTDSREFSTRSIPQRGHPSLTLLARVGTTDPTSLSGYRRAGGYTALLAALDKGPAWIIGEVMTANLTGRGGAAVPTGQKWTAMAAQQAPHYLVCRADESEPGAFHDRVLLEDDPFAIVESMTIAAFATGCVHGYVHLRTEYPLAKARLQYAIDTARAAGLLGSDIMGKGFAFDIEIRSGTGMPVRGEATPPSTLVNHVETLANLPAIVNHGGAAFAAIGGGISTGPKLFCLSGTVRNPGVYEVPFGTTLRQLYEMAGGVRADRRLQAILVGGAAGIFVQPEQLDIPLTFEGMRALGGTLGSGVLMVFDDTLDLKETMRHGEAPHRHVRDHTVGSVADEIALLHEVGSGMNTSLGRTTYPATESAAQPFRLFGPSESGRTPLPS